MALRNISSQIKTALADNDSLLVYHLVKFEKPSQLAREAQKATDYVYLTDAPYVVNYDSNDYHPGGLLKVGKVPENTEAKATSLSLTLSATKLGKQANAVSVTNSAISSETQGVLTVDFDLFKSGFYAGDTIKLTKRSDSSVSFRARIDSLFGDGTKVKITNLEDTTIAANSSVSFDIRFDSAEVDALVAGGVDNSGSETVFSSVSFDNYINRSVTIYRVFANPATGVRIGTPVLLFKGIIAKGTLNEKAQGAATITWALTSHWGDFVRVSGRITSDEFHRGVDSSGISNQDSALRPEYIHDLGFMHADSSLNVLATYTDLASRYKQVKRGGLAGLMGMKKLKEEKYEVTREMDLSINLDAKYIPLVYGVQKVDSIPVFADVVITQDANSEDNVTNGKTELFQAQVLCEGPIGGVYDIYMQDKSLVCRDKADSDVRLGSADDIPCFGRMDRGDVLTGGNLFTNTPMSEILYGSTEDLENTDIWRHDPNVIMQFPRLYGPNTNFQNSTTGKNGILHGQSFRATLANDIQITVHAGREDQEANQTLLGLANSVDFLVQQQYYQDDASTYWTANHKLLDTAYVVTRDSITAEDGKAPDLSFVVRGKFIDCHNYDGSYRISNGLHTNFALGDTVSITLADGTTSGGTARIVDKWSFLNALNLTEYRIRLGEFSSATTEASVITNGDVGKFSITKDSNTVTFLSPEYSNNPNAPVSPTTELAAGGFVFTGSNFTNKSVSIERKITNVTTYEPIYVNTADGPEMIGNQAVTRQNYRYTLDFSSLPTFTKDVLKVAGETFALVDLTLTANSYTTTLTVKTADIDASTMEYIVTGIAGEMEAIFGTPSNAAGTTTVTATGCNFVNRSLITQNASDSLDPTDTEGITIEITEEDVVPHDYSIRMPSTTALRTFCNTNNILCLNRGIHTRFTIGNVKYKYGVKGSHLDIEQWGDFRVSTNPAMQVLDYLTNDRYGKGLSLENDLDITSFREVARSCDTRSDVTVILPSTASLTEGDRYRYPATGDLLWEGKVSSVESITINVYESYKEVTFTDCIGKLGRKWNNWYGFSANELVWTKNGNWDVASSAGVMTTEPTTPGGVTVNLTKVGSNPAVNVALNTTFRTNIGNPFVKKRKNGNWISGYSLYDSDDVKYWKYVGWDTPDQRFVTRHQTNMTVDTSQSLFDNVNSMLRQFNGILRFANGTYFLDQKVKAKPITDFTSDEIITEDFIVGDIKITDKGIQKTFNSVNAQIIDPANNFEARSIAFYNSNYKKQDKGVPRQGSYEAPGISNYFNARMNIKQVLDESRAGLDISFTMAPRGYMLLAGNVIAISYDKFNWTKKLFRIESLSTRDDLLVDVVAKEHNDSAYVIEAPASDLVASYAQETGGKPIVKVRVPTSLTATDTGGGGIQLSWTNANNYNDATHTVEIWRSNTTSISNSFLIGTTKGTKYTDQILETGAQTRYYWIRYSIRSVNSIGNPITLHSKYEPRANTTGVGGDAISITTDELNTGVIVTDGGITFPDSPTGTPTISAGITSIGGGSSGFFLGYDGTNHVFQVGDPSGNNFSFDGTDLQLTGSEFKVTSSGSTAPSISGTTIAGKGSLLKADGDVLFGDAAGHHIFFDQSEGTITLGGDVVTENITAGTITTDKLAANSITTNTLAANVITAKHIEASSIVATLLTAATIQSNHIKANSVVSSLIDAETITSNHIKANSIVSTIIDATTITANDISTNNLSALSADLGAVTAGTMKGGTIPDADAAPSGTESGAFLNLTGGKMVFGNSNKYVLFDGTNLELNGVVIDSSSTVNASATPELTVQEDGSNKVTTADTLNFTTGIDVSVTGNTATISANNQTPSWVPLVNPNYLTGITTAQVRTAGALMDDELTDLVGVKGVTISTLQPKLSEGAFVDGDKTKLEGISTGADVTPSWVPSSNPNYLTGITTSQVRTAGALMDDELTDLTGVKGVTISTLQPKPSEGAFADGDKTKLDTVATNANNYVLPSANVTNASVSGNTLTLNREGVGNVTFNRRSYEEIRDVAAGLITGATHSGISVVHNDAANTLTITNDSPDQTVVLNSGSNVSISGTYPNFTIAASNTQRTDEDIQDLIGAMVSSNTETRMSATYDDTSGKLNFSADVQSDENFTSALKAKLVAVEDNADVTDTANVVASLSAGTNISIAADGTISSTNTQLTTENVQDIVGGMFGGNTQTRLSTTYNDTSGKINIVVDDMNDQVNNSTISFSTSSSGLNLDSDSSFTLNQSGNETITLNLDNNVIVNASKSGQTLTLTKEDGTTVALTNTDTNTQRSNEEIRDVAASLITSGVHTQVSAAHDDVNNRVNLSLNTAGPGAATYGSTGDNTKIDTITLDAYGRVTAVATGATGDITGVTVTAGTGMTGGGSATSGAYNKTLNVIGGDGITANANDIQVDSTVVRTSGAQTIAGNKTFSNNVTVSGNLTVSGTTTYINTTELDIGDNIIKLNADFTGSNPTESAGIEIERGTQANVLFQYKESGVGITGDLDAGWSVGTARLEATGFYGTFYGDASNLTNVSASDLAGFSTADLAEDPSATTSSGTMYFTNARAQAAITVNTGLDISGGTISLDLSEFTNMTGDMSASADQFIVLDNGAERKKTANTIKLSIFDNDAGFVSSSGVTSVATGSGLTGGTITGTGTISHADTSSQASVNNSNGTVIQDITLDTFGHITDINSVNLDGRYYTESESDARFTSIDHFRHTGHGNYTSTTTSALLTEALGDDAFDSKLTAHKTSWSYAGNGNLTDAGRFTELAGTSWLWWTDNSTDNVQGNITALAIAPTTGGSAGKVFIYNNQGASYSPGWREVWTSTSDGAGSGLDADLLDGQQGSYYAAASSIKDATITISAGTDLSTGGNFTTNQASAETITINHSNTTRTNTTSSVSPGYNSTFTAVDSVTTNARGHVTAVNTKTVTIPASDNTDTNYFVNSVSFSGGTLTLGRSGQGNLTVSLDGRYNPTIGTDSDVTTSGYSIIDDLTLTDGVITGSTTRNLYQLHALDTRNDGDVTPNSFPDKGLQVSFTDEIYNSPNTWDGVITVKGWADNYAAWQIFASSSADDNNSNLYFRRGRGTSWSGLQKVWTDANDGPSSGLNADLLDNQHGSYYLNYNNFTNKPTIPTNNNQLTNGAGYVTSSGNTTIGTDTNLDTSGAQVVDVLTLTDGVITAHSKRTLTLANLGYTGATNANYITNNNQLTNGAGYITNSGGTTASTANTVVKRDGSGDINARLFRSEYDTTNATIGFIMTQINTGSNNYIRPSTPAQVRSGLNVADGADVTPSWVPSTNPNYLTGITSNQVTTALGFTPYNSTNPSGFITNSTASLSGAKITSGTIAEARLPTQSKYLRSDTADTATGKLTLNGGLEVLSGSGGGALRIKRNSGSATGDDVTDIHMDDNALMFDIDNDNDGDGGVFYFRKKSGGNFAAPTAYLGTNQRIFADNYHPNADKWTTSRTLSLTGDVTGSVSWDGSANASITAAVVNNSHQHSSLFENATITFGASSLQWMDQNGAGGNGLNGNAPRNPTNGWYHNLIMNHGNSNGYYSQISTGLNTSDIYFSRVQQGVAKDWQRIFADDYHPNADTLTTARNIGVTLSGDVTGTGSASFNGSAAIDIAITTTGGGGVTGVTAGNGLSGGGSGAVSLAVDLNELNTATTALTTDFIPIVKASTNVSKKILLSEVIDDLDLVTGNVTGSLFAEVIQVNTLNANKITANSITAAQIQADAITANEINAGAITAEQLQISNNSSGSAGIFMDYNGGNSRIDIRDSSALRVRIGYLA